MENLVNKKKNILNSNYLIIYIGALALLIVFIFLFKEIFRMGEKNNELSSNISKLENGYVEITKKISEDSRLLNRLKNDVTDIKKEMNNNQNTIRTEQKKGRAKIDLADIEEEDYREKEKEPDDDISNLLKSVYNN